MMLLFSATVNLVAGKPGDVISLSLADLPVGLHLQDISNRQLLVILISKYYVRQHMFTMDLSVGDIFLSLVL